VLHGAAIVGGPEWLAYVGAPDGVVASARDGTWLAPLGAIGIAALLTLLAIYAFSSAGPVRGLPAPRTVLTLASIVFITRGAIVFPTLVLGRHWLRPFGMTILGAPLFFAVSSLAVLLIGVLLALGLATRSRVRSA